MYAVQLQSKLTYITRPLVGKKIFQSFRQKNLGSGVFLIKFRSEKLSHWDNIAPSFPQGRDSDGNHIQPVIQIFTESMLFNHLVQVPVRGADNTYISLARFVSAYFSVFTRFKNPQKLGRHAKGSSQLSSKKRIRCWQVQTGQVSLLWARKGTRLTEKLGLHTSEE